MISGIWLESPFHLLPELGRKHTGPQSDISPMHNSAAVWQAEEEVCQSERDMPGNAIDNKGGFTIENWMRKIDIPSTGMVQISGVSRGSAGLAGLRSRARRFSPPKVGFIGSYLGARSALSHPEPSEDFLPRFACQDILHHLMPVHGIANIALVWFDQNTNERPRFKER